MDVGVNTEPNLGSHWPKTQVPPAVAGACLSLCELAKVHLHCGIFWVCEEQLLQSLSAPPPSPLTVGFCPVQVLMVCLRATQGFILAVVKLSEPWAGWAAPGLGQGHHVVSLRLFSQGGSPHFQNRKMYSGQVVQQRKCLISSSAGNSGTGRNVSGRSLAGIFLRKQLLGQCSLLQGETVDHHGTYCHPKEYLPSLMLQIKYNWTVHNVSPHICFLQWMFAMQAPHSSWCLSLINMFSCEGSQCRSLAFTNGWGFWALAVIPDLWGWESGLDLLSPSAL